MKEQRLWVFSIVWETTGSDLQQKKIQELINKLGKTIMTQVII